MTRLDTIAMRQRNTRLRDLAFGTFIAAIVLATPAAIIAGLLASR